ncbi:unnamed protein product [Musa acuminata subsp. malaccensis]|uniref:(wild Malaysian banana) hypothetical protein n=1 Tax=Musa acuminata subsp. malaccensis TaxID=214687 RepID=A0A804JRL5_MUSAM|nr:unnamed protein product [Musa acuminata subsp. malaccensis]
MNRREKPFCSLSRATWLSSWHGEKEVMFISLGRQQDGSEDTASLFWDSRNHQSKSTMRSLS